MGLVAAVALTFLLVGAAAQAATPPWGEVWRGGGFDSSGYRNPAYASGLPNTGLTPGKFIDPVGFAVDTQDPTGGSDDTALYVLDRTSTLPYYITNSGDPGATTTWRLQKLNDQGEPLGTDEFSLPADQFNNYEMLGLAVDHSAGVVYALVVAFDQNGDPDPSFPNQVEEVYEVLEWSTTPTSGRLGPPAQVNADQLSQGVNGYPTPGLLSSSQLFDSSGNPLVLDPQGVAVDDVAGGPPQIAIASQDDSKDNYAADAGIAQICAAPPGTTGCPRGKISLQWSLASLKTIPYGRTLLENGADDGFPGDTPAGISTAPDGSLLLSLFNVGAQQYGEMNYAGGTEGPFQDVVKVPANLSSAGAQVLDAAADSFNPRSAAAASAVMAPPSQTSSNPGDFVYSSDFAAFEPGSYDMEDADSGGNPATETASPQVVALSSPGSSQTIGDYAAEIETEPYGQADCCGWSSSTLSYWTPVTPGVRILDPSVYGGSLSQSAEPLQSLVDTVGDSVVNSTPNVGPSTQGSSACSLSDPTTQASGSGDYPSLAAGANGALWVLTRGGDSTGYSQLGFSSIGGPNPTGGRELIELAPGGTYPCPSPSGTFNVSVNGGAPQPGGTVITHQGDSLTFDASAVQYPSTASPAAIAAGDCAPVSQCQYGAVNELRWSFGDGSPTQTFTTDDGNSDDAWPTPTVTHKYQSTGTYPVTLQIIGDFGTYAATGTVDVVAVGQPAAAFGYSPAEPQAGTPVSFDASASSAGAPGTTIENYHWDWGDSISGIGNDTTAPTFTHAFPSAGTYTVTLTITNSQNQQSSTSETITVAPPPPTSPGITGSSGSSGSGGASGSGGGSAGAGTGSSPKPPAVTASFRRVKADGELPVVLRCPAGQTRCTGTITVATLLRSTSGGGHERRLLVLGVARFDVRGGRRATVGVKITGRARRFLRRARSVRAVVEVKARNPQAVTYERFYHLLLRSPRAAESRHRGRGRGR